MDEVSITSHDVSGMCRLCLTSGNTVIDIFMFSKRFKHQIADVVMKVAPVQIIRRDKMPNFICQLCHTQLETSYKFQMQILQSEKTLRSHLQQFHASDIQIKSECFIQTPIETHFIHNIDPNITVKCEYLELPDVPTDYNSVNEISRDIFLKSEIKDEPFNDNLPSSAESAENIFKADCTETSYEDSKISIGDTKFVDMSVNWKEQTPIKKINDKMSLTSKIKDEKINSLISTECDNIDITSKDIHTSENVEFLRSADVTNYVDKCKEKTKNTAVNQMKNKTKEMNLNQFDISKVGCNVPSDLKKKKPKQTGEKPYQCDICNYRFQTTRNLKRHQRIHTGEKPYQCDVCNKSFKESYDLRRHQRIHQNIRIHTGVKPHQCDVCKKYFSELHHLNVHKRSHTGEKQFKCDLCSKQFTTSSHLKVHKRAHTGEKPHQCDVCKKCFSELPHLNVHRRIHTGEKPYQCDWCSKCFTTSSHLNVHKRTHTGEKPYQCDVCDKSFIDAGTLTRHQRTHTGEKPYQCDICNKHFSHLHNLKTHKLRHS